MEDKVDNKEEEIIEDKNNLFWKPEEFGFTKVYGDGIDRGSKWIKGKYTLVRLSSTLWTCKKVIGSIEDNKGITKSKLVTKWHMVIDNKELAKIYLTTGLRG